MRYVTRRRAYWDEDLEKEIVSPETIVVCEDEDTPECTGLLDQHGNDLYRVREKRPVGFRAGDEGTK